MLDFRLKTFLSVCDTMNYRKSAELLHITQPAVTQHIHYLEQHYGCKLFSYENRHLTKTDAAIILEQYGHTMELNEENLLHQLQNSSMQMLRVGTTKTIGECVIGPYAERFIACQDNELYLLVDNTRRLLDLINSCKLDFALVEGYFDKNRYGYFLFGEEPFVGVCAASHPFAGRDVSVSELLKETLICREEGSGTRAILENTLMEFNESISHFKRRIYISSFPLIMDYVKKNLGISFVYEVLAKQHGLATFTVQGEEIRREFNLIYLKDTGAEKKIQYFLKGSMA